MKTKAFSFITGILLFTGVIMIALLAIAVLHVSSGKSEYIGRTYHELEAFSDGCAEEAIVRLKYDSMYRGSGLSDTDKSCTMNVEEISPANYRISITAMNLNNQSLGISIEVFRNVSGHGTNMDILSFSAL